MLCHKVNESTLIIKAEEQSKRAQSDPTLCCDSIKLRQYCNESLLGKWYVSKAAYILQGTNLLLWLQTSRALWNTPPDTQYRGGSGHTLAAHCDVYTMDSLGRTRQRANQTTMSGSAYPRTADKLQYSCPANPLICKRKSQKIGYSLKEHLAAPQTIVIVSLWPYMRKLVNVFWHISPHKTTKSQVWLCHVTVCV